MIKGIKQEFECIANKTTRLTRHVEYFLEANHPRKLVRNDFGAEVISHKTVDDWEFVKIKEIILYLDGLYCLVNYMQGKGQHSNPCVYTAEPIGAGFIKQEE